MFWEVFFEGMEKKVIDLLSSIDHVVRGCMYKGIRSVGGWKALY